MMNEGYGTPDSENPEWTKEDLRKATRSVPPGIERAMSYARLRAEMERVRVAAAEGDAQRCLEIATDALAEEETS